MQYVRLLPCFLFCLLQLVFSESFASKGSFYIKGRIISKPVDSAWWHTVYLSKMSSINDLYMCSRQLIVDSAVIDRNGVFVFKREAVIENNSFYRMEVVTSEYAGKAMLTMGGISENFAVLLLDKNSQIEFETELARFNYAFRPLKMNAANRSIRAVYEMQRSNNEKIEPILARRRRLEDDPSASPDTIKYLRGLGMDMINNQTKEMMSVIDTIKNPYVSLLTLLFYFQDDSAFCMNLNSRYQREIPHSKYAGQLFDMLYDIYFTLPVGSPAPEISLPDKSGNMIKLSDFRGNYVLIDFWATWCHPCRMENQEIMKPLFKRFGSSNFNILGISMDVNKDVWQKTLVTDGLDWTELCDGKSFNSDVARSYKVFDSVPAIYVVDPAGNIIAKNLHNKELENFIVKCLTGK